MYVCYELDNYIKLLDLCVFIDLEDFKGYFYISYMLF